MNVGAPPDLMHQIQQSQPAQVKPQRDADGDNDGSRAGEVEQAEGNNGTTETLGTNINVTA